MVEPELIDEVPIDFPLSSRTSLRPLRPTSTAGCPDIDSMPSLAPVPPCSMNATTALQALCMMLSEPEATACWPGETPIETVSISTPAAAKNPFLLATKPGHSVAVGDTCPKLTRSTARPGASASMAAKRQATRPPRMERLRSRPPPGSTLHARPGLGLAEDEQASGHMKRVGAGLGDGARIRVAVLCVVEAPDVLVRILRGRTEVDRDLRSDHRPRSPGGIRILRVGERLAGLGIDRLPEPDDRAAHAGAAPRHPDLGIGRIGQPHAGNVCGLRRPDEREAESRKRNCKIPRHRRVPVLEGRPRRRAISTGRELSRASAATPVRSLARFSRRYDCERRVQKRRQ